MAGKRSSSSFRPRSRNAVVLVDYTNLFGVVSERTDNDQPDAVVLDLINALKKHVSEQFHLKPIRTAAFANLPPGNVRGHRATGAWLGQGIEPHFSFARSTDEAAAIELAMEALELATESGPGTAFIILSGNQWFVPLVQRLYRKGHFVVMATLESPSHSDDLPSDCKDLYLNADFLLGGPGRILEYPRDSEDDTSAEYASQKPSEIGIIENEDAKRTLEIIDSYFGQYEEIYLTPLLRKLSEMFDDPGDEPKTLISDLEDAGAVWLEKRRGFPHNYTVLMMNEEHPDVAELKKASANAETEEFEEYYGDYSKDDSESENYDSDSESDEEITSPDFDEPEYQDR